MAVQEERMPRRGAPQVGGVKQGKIFHLVDNDEFRIQSSVGIRTQKNIVNDSQCSSPTSSERASQKETVASSGYSWHCSALSLSTPPPVLASELRLPGHTSLDILYSFFCVGLLCLDETLRRKNSVSSACFKLWPFHGLGQNIWTTFEYDVYVCLCQPLVWWWYRFS